MNNRKIKIVLQNNDNYHFQLFKNNGVEIFSELHLDLIINLCNKKIRFCYINIYIFFSFLFLIGFDKQATDKPIWVKKKKKNKYRLKERGERKKSEWKIKKKKIE